MLSKPVCIHAICFDLVRSILEQREYNGGCASHAQRIENIVNNNIFPIYNIKLCNHAVRCILSTFHRAQKSLKKLLTMQCNDILIAHTLAVEII